MSYSFFFFLPCLTFFSIIFIIRSASSSIFFLHLHHQIDLSVNRNSNRNRAEISVQWTHGSVTVCDLAYRKILARYRLEAKLGRFVTDASYFVSFITKPFMGFRCHFLLSHLLFSIFYVRTEIKFALASLVGTWKFADLSFLIYL